MDENTVRVKFAHTAMLIVIVKYKLLGANWGQKESIWGQKQPKGGQRCLQIFNY